MRIPRGSIIAGILLVATAAATVQYVRVDSEQEAHINATFAALPRLPGAAAVSTKHENRHATESYLTSRTSAEIIDYYTDQLSQMGWATSGATWSLNGLAFRCFGEPIGRLTTKLTTRTAPQPGSFTYSIDVTTEGCSPQSLLQLREPV